MFYSTNCNSPGSPRTPVLVMNLVVKARNLWHERVDNLPKVRQVMSSRSLICPHVELVPCILDLEPLCLTPPVYHLELMF